MPTLEVTEKQLRLIQDALDFYSRVGIGQMHEIVKHPTFENILYDRLSPKKPLNIGDKTDRGEIVEMGDGYIKTKGSWGNGEKIKTWGDVHNIKHSIDYGRFHKIRDQAIDKFNEGRNLLIQEEMHKNASFGIHNSDVDESCRVAFDIIQVIRHEFWKQNPFRSEMTVDSNVYIYTEDGFKIKCKIL